MGVSSSWMKVWRTCHFRTGKHRQCSQCWMKWHTMFVVFDFTRRQGCYLIYRVPTRTQSVLECGTIAAYSETEQPFVDRSERVFEPRIPHCVVYGIGPYPTWCETYQHYNLLLSNWIDYTNLFKLLIQSDLDSITSMPPHLKSPNKDKIGNRMRKDSSLSKNTMPVVDRSKQIFEPTNSAIVWSLVLTSSRVIRNCEARICTINTISCFFYLGPEAS